MILCSRNICVAIRAQAVIKVEFSWCNPVFPWGKRKVCLRFYVILYILSALVIGELGPDSYFS